MIVNVRAAAGGSGSSVVRVRTGALSQPGPNRTTAAVPARHPRPSRPTVRGGSTVPAARRVVPAGAGYSSADRPSMTKRRTTAFRPPRTSGAGPERPGRRPRADEEDHGPLARVVGTGRFGDPARHGAPVGGRTRPAEGPSRGRGDRVAGHRAAAHRDGPDPCRARRDGLAAPLDDRLAPGHRAG